MKNLVHILFLTVFISSAQEKIILKYENKILYQYSDLYKEYFETFDYQIETKNNKTTIWHYDNKNYRVTTDRKLKIKEVYANRTVIKIKLIENQSIKFILTEYL